MADVHDTLPEWSSTTASNNPSGATTIGTGLDDNIREIQGVVTRWLSHKGSDIASVAGTTDIGAVEGLLHDITGTNAITGLGTVRAGIWKLLKFEGAASLVHNATSLILPGAANITCADGDVGLFMSEGSGNWRCLAYMHADGRQRGSILATEQATTSGTEKDFTIPSWAKKIVIQFVGVSTSGTNDLFIRLGDGGGIEDTGYTSKVLMLATSGTTAEDETTAFIAGQLAASSVLHGTITLTLEDAAGFTWVSTGILNYSDATTQMALSSGSKSLSAALTTVRITTDGGTDTFDAGAVNVLYE